MNILKIFITLQYAKLLSCGNTSRVLRAALSTYYYNDPPNERWAQMGAKNHGQSCLIWWHSEGKKY